MLKLYYIISVICVTLMAFPAWGLDLNPGKYEITVTTKMEIPSMQGGMPEIPPQTLTQCLTRQDPIPPSSADAKGCKVTDMKTQGNTLTYTMVCKQQGQTINSSGKMTYKGDAFKGTTKTDMGSNGGNMTVTTMMSGKRIGKCD